MSARWSESEWAERSAAFPLGSRVEGVVEHHASFGMFVTLDACPRVRAIVEAIAYLPEGVPVDPAAWPVPGSPINGVVVAHTAHNQQIKLRVSPARHGTA
ncbi:hypothetical protein [Streptomyces sp. URMC 123]|uniref:hypothetical protein n=1 Tax=Streptomyces sp. URMC 123 TaxID=3423403 RepID=UPI003F1BDCE2